MLVKWVGPIKTKLKLKLHTVGPYQIVSLIWDTDAQRVGSC